MLDKIDTIIERTGVNYSKAKDALEQNNFDVVEAIIAIEKEGTETSEPKSETKETFENAKEKGANILKMIFALIQKSLKIEVAWRKGEETFLQLPLLVVIIFTLWLMPWSILILAAPFFFGIKTVLKLRTGTETDLADWFKNKSK